MQKVLILVGPTASGKSALAVELAKQLGGEVISADSRQVYRGLDIGTGKITKREMHGVPHHLLDVANPKQPFTAADFVRLADAAIADIAKRGKLPIICGGTGFYIDALMGRVPVPEVAPDAALRKRLANKSAEELCTMLQKLDPARAKTIDTNNPVRLVRAIEIAQALGKVPKPKLGTRYDALWLGISLPQATLAKRIQTRTTQRMRRGMVTEAKRLHEGGLSYKRMGELGLEYRLLSEHLKGMLTKTELAAHIAHSDAQYARKQLQYWKRNSEITWIPLSAKRRFISAVKAWLR